MTARAALMEVIGSTLATEAEKRKKGTEKAKEFLERINWFRLAKLVAGSAGLAVRSESPLVGLLGRGMWEWDKGLKLAVALMIKRVGEIEHAAKGCGGCRDLAW